MYVVVRPNASVKKSDQFDRFLSSSFVFGVSALFSHHDFSSSDAQEFQLSPNQLSNVQLKPNQAKCVNNPKF